MVVGDALLLPLCMVISVALRLSSLEGALNSNLTAQLTLALFALPVLALAGLYRAVMRYIDLRVLLAASTALGTVVLLVFALALLFRIQWFPRSALLLFWFVAFAYVVASRFIARALVRRGLGQAGQLRIASLRPATPRRPRRSSRDGGALRAPGCFVNQGANTSMFNSSIAAKCLTLAVSNVA